MLRVTTLALQFALVTSLVPLGPALRAYADDTSETRGDFDGRGTLRVEEPWARASAGQVSAGVVYMKLVNLGAAPDQLLSVKTPVAAKAAVHQTLRNRDTVSMRHIMNLEVPPSRKDEDEVGGRQGGVATRLEPGGLHIMLMGLTAPLEVGQTFPMTLTFEHAGALSIQVNVLGVGAMNAHESF